MIDFDSIFKTGVVLDNKFRIEEKLGTGAMGRVLKVFDTILHEERAIKTFLPDKKISESEYEMKKGLFIHEAKLATQIAPHPNLIRVFSIEIIREASCSSQASTQDFRGIDRPIPYIVMAYVKGKTLKEWMKENPLPDRLEACYGIIKEICDGLDTAHRSMTHRDLKPDNILISDEGKPIVMDFGVSTSNKVVGEDAGDPTLETARQLRKCIAGTPKYMSPEQFDLNLDIDNRTDIYSFAVVVYEMLTGKFPAIKCKKNGPYKIPISMDEVEMPSDLNPNIFPQFDAIVMKAMSLDREERHRTIKEFAADISNAVSAAKEAEL